MENCPFCKIISGEVESKIVYQDDLVTAFKDYDPKAPVHLLIIPNRHITSVNEVEPGDEIILGRLFITARQLAEQNQIHQTGYRLVVNTGKDAFQSVMHIHMHLIGGRHLSNIFRD